MTRLLSTTALVVALGFPAVTLAQATDATTNTETQQQNGSMSGFLAERGQSGLHASELLGHEVLAHSSAKDSDDATMSQDRASGDDAGNRTMATMSQGDLDELESIGEINEIILSSDGQVRALVVGVGGFLGMGERDVAMTMDQVTFKTDADDPSEIHIIANTDKETLENAPAYDRTAAMNGAARSDDRDRNGDRSAFTAPEIDREGFARVAAQDISTDMLTGKTVYDVNDNDVGDVTDMILDDDGKITRVIIDFGGFLGIGSSQAALGFEELTIVANDGNEDVRLYVDATREQIQDLPEYTGTN